MNKVFIKGITIVVLFISTWFLFKQINWVEVFRIKSISDKTEEKLGDLFWEMFQKSESENKNSVVNSSVDSIISQICKTNKIDRKFIKIHILNKDEINAFALPNGHLVIYSGLILNTDNQEELCGVICHELAHIQLKHVMRKLINEVGLSVLISITTGNGGSEIMKKTAKMLSSSAFDRKLEKEADIKAVDFLVNAKINPNPFADFLYKIAEKENDSDKYFTWISTHPESRERAKYIIEYSKQFNSNYKPIISIKTWENIKTSLTEK